LDAAASRAGLEHLLLLELAAQLVHLELVLRDRALLALLQLEGPVGVLTGLS
jgi:hypothetical protein